MDNNEKNSALSDEELIHRFRNSHDSKYVGELYVRYTHLVYGVCLKYLQNEADAQDATMQIFEGLLQSLKKHEVQAFKPWLHTVVKNYCMMQFRNENKEAKKLENIKTNQVKNVEIDDDLHLQENEKEKLVNYLNEGLLELKKEQQECVQAFYIENKSYQEIATAFNYTINEVKSHIQNGKRNLKSFINKQQNG